MNNEAATDEDTTTGMNGEAMNEETNASPALALITSAPIDERLVRESVDADDCGAVVVFYGVIRDHDGGRSGVTQLDYSAHPEAEQLLSALVADEMARTGLRLCAVHRIGSLTVGDAALVAAAAAPHRSEAFAAIEQLVERVKAEIPIWKRQHFTEGMTEWVGL